MAVKKSTKPVKKAKKVVMKKKTTTVAAVAPRKRQQSISERFHDRNVQAGIVAVLLGFTFLLLLITYFNAH